LENRNPGSSPWLVLTAHRAARRKPGPGRSLTPSERALAAIGDDVRRLRAGGRCEAESPSAPVASPAGSSAAPSPEEQAVAQRPVEPECQVCIFIAMDIR
jgi:hypothetical protein